MGKGSPGPRVTAPLSSRFKYVIGIGVGAGAYVLAKFAVSFPRTVPPTPRQGWPSWDNSSATGTFLLFLLSPSLPPSLPPASSSLRKVFFSFFVSKEVNFF